MAILMPVTSCPCAAWVPLQVEGTQEDWFVYKLPRKQQQQQQQPGEDDDLLTATVSVGRHSVTKVRVETVDA